MKNEHAAADPTTPPSIHPNTVFHSVFRLISPPSRLIVPISTRAPGEATGSAKPLGTQVARGEPLGRPRVKFHSIEEMVEAARGGLDSSDG